MRCKYSHSSPWWTSQRVLISEMPGLPSEPWALTFCKYEESCENTTSPAADYFFGTTELPAEHVCRVQRKEEDLFVC